MQNTSSVPSISSYSYRFWIQQDTVIVKYNFFHNLQKAAKMHIA